MFNPIAASFVPSQQATVRPVVNPREFSPDDWRFRLGLSAPSWELPADQQTDNFYDLNEGYKEVGIAMFNPLTGEEPIYGHRNDFLNPLDQEQTNRQVNDIYKVTRVQDVNGVNKINRNPLIEYPVAPTYTNFEGSTFGIMNSRKTERQRSTIGRTIARL